MAESLADAYEHEKRAFELLIDDLAKTQADEELFDRVVGGIRNSKELFMNSARVRLAFLTIEEEMASAHPE